VQQRIPSLLADPIGFAHRGARAYARENTIEAFELALAQGATGLESDVWLTADGVPVLDHDGLVGRRRPRRRRIRTLAREELPAHIPGLADVLALCGPSVHVSLDVKDPEAGPAVVELLERAHPEMRPRVWLCSSWQQLLPLRGSGVKLVDSTRLHRIGEGPERRAATLAEHGIDAINLHHSDWNGGLVTLFHRFERVAFAWDVQQPHLLESVWRMGIDGLFSDHPDRMMATRRDVLG